MASRSSVVKVSVLADADQFNRTMKSADSAAGKFGKAMDTAKFAVAALAGSQVVGAVVSFGKRMQDLATTAEGVETRFDTVFGDIADTMGAWVDDQNEAFGTSEVGLKNLAAGIGDLLVPLGFARDEAAGMTQEVLLLANALSEWTSGQVSVEQASEAVRKSLLGEREMLKELGVAISEADVKQALLEAGMGGLTGEALAQAKAQVTLELITRKSTDALTAYEQRTGTALAEQKAFTAAIADSEQTLAEAFAPEVEYVQGLMLNAGRNAADLADDLAGLRGESDDAADSQRSLTAELDNYGRVIRGVQNPVQWIIDSIRAQGEESEEATSQLAELSTGMDRARHSAAGAGDEFDEEAQALDELRGNADRASAAIAELHAEQMAAISPAVKLFNATKDYNDAAEELARLQRDGKKGSEEYAEAQLEVLESLARLHAAQDGFSSDEQMVAALRELGRQAGMTEDQIDDLIRKILQLDGASVSVGGSGSRFEIEANAPQYSFHDGGVVPGPIGVEQLALVKGGETILPTHKPGFNMGGGSETIQVVLDGAVIAEAVRRHNTVAERHGVY